MSNKRKPGPRPQFGEAKKPVSLMLTPELVSHVKSLLYGYECSTGHHVSMALYVECIVRLAVGLESALDDDVLNAIDGGGE